MLTLLVDEFHQLTLCSMITIISGTDRKDGLTHILATHYQTLIESKTTEGVNVFSLENLPPDLYGAAMYKKDRSEERRVGKECA